MYAVKRGNVITNQQCNIKGIYIYYANIVDNSYSSCLSWIYFAKASKDLRTICHCIDKVTPPP